MLNRLKICNKIYDALESEKPKAKSTSLLVEIQQYCGSILLFEVSIHGKAKQNKTLINTYTDKQEAYEASAEVLTLVSI